MTRNAQYLAFAIAIARESQRRSRSEQPALDPALFSGASLGEILAELLDGKRDSSWLNEWLGEYVTKTRGEEVIARHAKISIDDLIVNVSRMIANAGESTRFVDVCHLTESLKNLYAIKHGIET